MLRDKTGENFLIDLYERLIEKDVKIRKKYAKTIEKVSNVIRDVQCQMSFFVQTVEEAVYYEAVGGYGFGISASIENAEATALARYATGIKKSVGDKISDTSVVVIDEIKFDFAAFFCHMITGSIATTKIGEEPSPAETYYPYAELSFGVAGGGYAIIGGSAEIGIDIGYIINKYYDYCRN
jgi:hypothetical protein